jgi:hypothetical protein
MIYYPALFEPDVNKGGFVVTFPDFEAAAQSAAAECPCAVPARPFESGRRASLWSCSILLDWSKSRPHSEP